MKFVYEYRTSDNAKHSGEIRAASRDDAFSALKAKGIKPFSVEEASGFFNKLFGKGKRWLAIAVLAIIAALSLDYALTVRSEIDIADFTDRHQIYGDPSIIANMEEGGYSSVFDLAGERYLAFYAQPGREVRLPRELSSKVETLDECLAHEIIVADSDPREVAELKRIVNGMKKELAAYLEEASVKDFVRALNERQTEERLIYQRVVNELNGSTDRALYEERNRSLRDLGLPTIPLPVRK